MAPKLLLLYKVHIHRFWRLGLGCLWRTIIQPTTPGQPRSKRRGKRKEKPDFLPHPPKKNRGWQLVKRTMGL